MANRDVKGELLIGKFCRGKYEYIQAGNSDVRPISIILENEDLGENKTNMQLYIIY